MSLKQINVCILDLSDKFVRKTKAAGEAKALSQNFVDLESADVRTAPDAGSLTY